MKFTGQFVGTKFDLAAYNQQLRNRLTHELHRVASAWLEAVIGRIPIWSGMSRASLLELSELVGQKLLIAPKRGVASRIAEGRALGTAIQQLGPNDFTITIITDVEHYNIQEYRRVGTGRGSPSAPWRSLDAGAIAFYSAAQTVSIPPLLLRPVVKRIR